MTNKFHQKLQWGICLALILALLMAGMALADDISNNLDATVDTVAEVMPLNVGGANGTTTLYLVERNGDGKNGCNLTGQTTLVLSVSSSDTSVATVSPSSVTFTSCGFTQVLTVTPNNQGSATISVSQTSNNTGGSFYLAPATFMVYVAPPPNTPPQISISGVTGGASYETGSVPAATCQVTDAEDGNSSFSATLSAVSGPLAAYGLGEQTASCSYTDGGGLTASASVTYGIVDTSAPVITFVGRTPANGKGWNNGDVTVNWSCSDSGSGVVAASVSQTVSAEGADQSATGTCEDHAGNTASDTQTGINIDKTAPTASASASPSANGNGWNNTNVTVSFIGSDGLSGIDFCDADVVLNSEGAGQSASGTCTDKAGNISASATESGINIDKTAPTMSPSVSPNPIILNGSATASANASDSLSGVASYSCGTVDTSSVGTKSVACTATDEAGNTVTASANYSVNYKICALYDQTKSHKKGSTVPIKLQLCDVNGVNYSSSSIVVNATGLAKLDSTASAWVEDSGYANPDDNFRYSGDLLGYIFNLSTKNLTTGTWKLTFIVDGVSEGSYWVKFDVK